MGLTTKEANARLAKDGENRLAQSKAINPAGIFAGQFKDAMVIILLIATAVSVVMGEYLDAGAIVVVVILNAILGFIQEYRAEKTLEALKKLSAPNASVYRDGRVTQIPAERLVCGDVVRLEAGSRIPADCRLIKAMAFEVDEALLTGESLPIAKLNEAAVYMGTSVVRGHGVAEITGTGQATQMGQISNMLSDVEEERTPLQKKLGELGKIIGLICLAVCFAVSVLGIVRGHGIFEMLFTGISLAVAAIPEGLPAVVTISLALAVRRIYKQRALVNKLHSVETLGCANVICTDKTGTLTLNKMTVTEHWLLKETNKSQLHKCCLLCNNGFDPTEKALNKFAQADISGFTRLDEIPYESSSAFMQVTVKSSSDSSNQSFDYIKGSLEVVLKKCCVNQTERSKIVTACNSMTKKALRSLAFAYRKVGDEHFTFIGLVGMSDPLRPEIKNAVSKCKKAGIRVIMLTGDHKNTADEIARQAGIDEVHARMTPADKLKLVKQLKANGDIVAMTGDGVNDAPAVKEAAIGVSMGISGTDVTKEAAQLVLLDDNFATLVSAVEEGRTIYNNIKKSMKYMLSSNIGEVLTMLLAMLMGLPIVLIPIQILLINLVTDGLPAIALSMEPATDNIMKQPPRKSNESIFAGGMFGAIIARGIAIGLCTLTVFWLTLGSFDVSVARTAAMATLGLSQLIFVFECKDRGRGIFNANYGNNPHLVFAVLISAVIIFTAMLSGLPTLILQTVPLERETIMLVLAFAAGVPVVKGLGKLLFIEENEPKKV
jgi:Ca2+-transporting ATPase